MVTEWASFNASLYVQTRGKEIPARSEAEQNKKTNWAKVKQYADFLERMHFEVEQARQSPAHFGAFIGMPDILGEPDDHTTFDEHKQLEAERLAAIPEESKVYLLERFRNAAESGATFGPSTNPAGG